MKKIYLHKIFICLIIVISCSTQGAFAQMDTINIDFGDVNISSSSPWNNLTTSYSLSQIDDCLNSKGNYTGITVALTDAFGGMNKDGRVANDSLNIVDSAASDSFYGQSSNPSGAITFSNLDPSKSYNFAFYGSREATDNRETKYVVQGSNSGTDYLDAASNSEYMAHVNNIIPDSEGTITVTVSAGSNNTNSAGYFYLGALVLTYDGTEGVGEKELELETGNGGEYYEVGKQVEIKWNSQNISSLYIEYSADNGSTWNEISALTSASTGVFEWTVPSDVSNDCLIRISDASDLTITDTSDESFNIIEADVDSYRIVVIGSSTASGAGVSVIDSAWVWRYEQYLVDHDTRFEVINLALGGYTTYNLLPTGTTITGVDETVDTERNITKALSYNPDAVIINLPSNDAASNYPVEDQIDNYNIISSAAESENVLLWVTTPQPRNMYGTPIQIQLDMVDETFTLFNDFTLDFWYGFNNASGRLKSEYDSGDGIHLNDMAHGILFQRAVEKHIMEIIRGESVADNELPHTPTELTGSGITKESFTLSWLGSYDNYGPAVYEVYIDGESQGTTEETSIDVSGLTCSTMYSMKVVAYDKAGNSSEESSVLGVTTSSCDSNNDQEGYVTVKVDLGDSANESPFPWNNITSASYESQVDNCTDSDGNYTGITVVLKDFFTGVNRDGLSANASFNIADQASADSFYGESSNPTGAIRFSNLDTDIAYDFSIFASRDAGDNREAKYVASGSNESTSYLDAASNTDNIVQINGIYPNSEGTITITASAGPNNSNSAGYFYLGAVIMSYEEPEVDQEPDPIGTICNWDSDKSAAVALTFDDWSPSHYPVVVSELKNYELNATFFPIITSITNYDYPWPYVQEAVANGNEVGNHTETHVKLTEQTASRISDEVRGAKEIFDNNLTSQTVVSFAYPNGAYNSQVIDSVRNAGHICARGIYSPTTYSYLFATADDDYYNLKTYKVQTSTSTADYSNQITKVIAGGGLLTYMYHSVDDAEGTYNDNWYAQIMVDSLTKQFDYLTSLQDEIWITTLGQAVKYHKEARCATLNEVSGYDGTEWIVSLTDTLSDNSLFNQPLTIKLKANGISYDEIVQDGNSIQIESFNNDTIMFKAIPDAGDITLKTSVATGINNPLDKAFKVYPVPAGDRLYIEMKDAYKEISVKLIDLSGNAVYQSDDYSQTNKISLNFIGINPGVYMLSIKTEDSSFVTKIIKK